MTQAVDESHNLPFITALLRVVSGSLEILKGKEKANT